MTQQNGAYGPVASLETQLGYSLKGKDVEGAWQRYNYD